jgi:hypothetical protein
VLFRSKGYWYKINPKPYEPTTQTFKIAYDLARAPEKSPEEVYRIYYEERRKEMKVLYPSFLKDVD